MKRMTFQEPLALILSTLDGAFGFHVFVLFFEQKAPSSEIKKYSQLVMKCFFFFFHR